MRVERVVPYEAMVASMHRLVIVACPTAEGGSFVPLRVVHVTVPTRRGRLVAFTADLVGANGTALSRAGRYPVRVDDLLVDITISWISVQQERTRYRATFVHDDSIRWSRRERIASRARLLASTGAGGL